MDTRVDGGKEEEDEDEDEEGRVALVRLSNYPFFY